MSYTKMNIWLQYMFNSVCFVGICLSAYALVIEFQTESDPNYKPMCDFSDSVSCSKALLSKWGKGFGIVGPLLGHEHILNQRNPVLGIIFYTLLVILGSINYIIVATLVIWLAVLSNLASIYLAVVLYFDVKSLCLVCVSSYIVNFILLIMAIYRRRVLRKVTRKKRD